MSQPLGDDRIRHLEMLQAAIARIAGASATIKNLSLIVVAGALALLATTPVPTVALFAAALTVAFWLLDARYLQQEKWFRDLYDAEREREPSEPASFVMTPSPQLRNTTGLAYGLQSWSTWGLYAPVIVFLLILWLALPSAGGG